MSVSLTVAESLDGSAIADSLEGGGTGFDLGSVTNGAFAPIVDQSTNDGRQLLYIRHDAATDPITDVKTFIQEFGTGTGFTYGGADTPSGDFAELKSLANASDGDNNNSTGNGGGLRIDMDADASLSNEFDQASFPTLVKIYGDGLTDGIDLASAFTLVGDAMVIDSDQSSGNDGEGAFMPSAPEDGKIGKDNDGALGDNAKCKLRIYLPSSFASGGIFQAEWVIAYSFTS